MKNNNLFVSCALLLLVFFGIRDARGESENLVYFVEGTIPILITAPHGGSEQPANVNERTGFDLNGIPVEDFNIVKDSWTKGIAKDIVSKYSQKYGGTPYIVAAEFHRKYIDANRPEHQAFESKNARLYYESYHSKIETFINDIQRKFGQGILLDIHGQAQHPAEIIRGTRNGFSVEKLLTKHGWDAVVGSHSFFGLLSEQGFTIQPDNSQIPTDALPTPESNLSGGATIKFNGSHNTEGLDAIQFEIGSDIRFSETQRNWFTDRMADNIRTFMKYHYCDDNDSQFPCSPKTIVVDHDYKGYFETNGWQSSSAVDNYPKEKLSQSRYANQENETVSWQAKATQSGFYQVYAWWSNRKPNGSNYSRDSSAEYIIQSGSANISISKNQNTSAGQWVLLGSVSAQQNDTIKVSLTRQHDGEQGAATIADAMAFVWAGTGN
ncbi:hypothetical protein [Aliikangiella coralliicola]|uniref:Golvesin/Xly CBD-like domain-containing protein n=1 Tax=Aliikangiella coralliicola TaxID=2592383 RepID=A0A545U8X5_9GAMM|nr:hypothetical protein [Aliikangiella coralliicola]TQV85915.1 hypothetical protein FLL46_18505 [Aliikangiella coralliicola]